jgi:3-phenylpropionate/trans-cinnamate dioxygenase ferredoxin reductase component
MEEKAYTYVIVGGGLAGASAVSGIREIDPNGPILLISGEKYLPYDRPPLSKKLWFGKKKVEEIFLHEREFYEKRGVTLALGCIAGDIDPARKKVTGNGQNFRYEKLLLATGAVPNRLQISGATLEGVCYYRFLDDYLKIKSQAGQGKSAVVIGGGFIGSEIAAALTVNNMKVTMVFPAARLCDRVFPEYLGNSIQRHYQERGVRVLHGDKPASIVKNNGTFITVTESGKKIESDVVIVGVGVTPEMWLARSADITTANGIVVNEFLETSRAGIYAAGDNAFFHSKALGRAMRVEHWDNALNQGKLAGRNMAGAHEPYTYLPYFFSDLFEFGYEAVGEIEAKLETYADWQTVNEKGVIYYLKDKKVKGVMMCNVWNKVEAARELILKAEVVDTANLKSVIA